MSVKRYLIESAAGNFSCRSDQTLLTAASKQGIPFKQACRNGNCYVCHVPLISGVVKPTNPYQKHTHPNGSILLCQACPASTAELGKR